MVRYKNTIIFKRHSTPIMTDTSSTFEKMHHSARLWLFDIQLAVVFLTRIPWRLNDEVPPQALNRALRVFPFIGLLVGGIAATVFGLGTLMHLPPMACALLAVLSSILITGALHEDGLGDVADGFGGGLTRERKLEIMRDSRVGAYGVLAMVIALGLRVAALDGFEDAGMACAALIGVACLSRTAPAMLIHFLEPARTDGLAASMEKPDRIQTLQTALIGCALFSLCSPFAAGWLAIGICAVVLMAFAKLAEAQIGGQTGDVCGASQQIIEIVALLTLVGMQ